VPALRRCARAFLTARPFETTASQSPQGEDSKQDLVLRSRRRWRLEASLGAAVFLFGLIGTPAAAQDIHVDVELVLAVDVSASIDGGEVNLQRAGYVQALTDPRVIDAMLAGPLGRVALTYVEWSETQRVTVGWTVIASRADALVFAAAVEASPLPRGGLTSITGVLDFTSLLFDGNGIEGTRQVIDVSADGRDSRGMEEEVSAARDRALARGIIINGLVINPQLEQTEVEGVKHDLDGYFREVVIGGPGAFTVVTRSPADFPHALVNKLVLEIAASGVFRSAGTLWYLGNCPVGFPARLRGATTQRNKVQRT